MFHRALLLLLTSLTTYSVGASAIAQPLLSEITGEGRDRPLLLSQADGTDADSATPPPSAAVRSLQNRLAELGYYEAPVNGVFDAATRDALIAFQQENGLVGTGIIDPLTQERLASAEAPSAAGDTATTPTPSESTLPEANNNLEEALPEGDSPSSLPEVPEENTSEELLTPEDVEAEAESELDLAPSDDAATNNSSAGETATEGTENTPTTSETEESENSRALPLVLLGVIILALGSIGAALILWFSKRRGDADDKSSEAPAELSHSAPAAESPAHFDLSPARTSPTDAIAHNGKPSDSPQDTPSSIDVSHQSMTLSNPAEPRIAKVNIIDELIQDLEQPDPDVRHKAIWELGQRGNSAAVQPLVNLLAEADSNEQSLILAALSEISTKTLKPMNRAVAIALQNENPEVRKNAIRDLTRIYDSLSQVGRMLGHASIDDDPDVRQTANWALDQLHKMRLKATDTAALLQEGSPTTDRLPEDGSSSQRL